jgi:nitroreductase
MGTTADSLAGALTVVMQQRFSCRGFRSDPVPRPVIERILEMARLSPSWCNTQPWGVIITEGAGTESVRAGLGSYISGATSEVPPTPDIPFPERYEGATLARRRECAWQLYESVGIEKGDRVGSLRQAAENFTLFGAPHLAVITTDAALGTYGAVDCGLYISAFLLAAQSVGVATIPQAAIAVCAPFLHGHLSIPEDREVLCGISFGYADESHPANGFRTTRAPLSETVIWAEG